MLTPIILPQMQAGSLLSHRMSCTIVAWVYACAFVRDRLLGTDNREVVPSGAVPDSVARSLARVGRPDRRPRPPRPADRARPVGLAPAPGPGQLRVRHQRRTAPPLRRALLHDVLHDAGPGFDPARRKDRLRFLIAVAGADGHHALLTWAEIDPDFGHAPVLLAVGIDDTPLDRAGPSSCCPRTAAAPGTSAASTRSVWTGATRRGRRRAGHGRHAPASASLTRRGGRGCCCASWSTWSRWPGAALRPRGGRLLRLAALVVRRDPPSRT